MEYYLSMAVICCIFLIGIFISSRREWLGIILICVGFLGICLHLHYKLEQENQQLIEKYGNPDYLPDKAAP